MGATRRGAACRDGAFLTRHTRSHACPANKQTPHCQGCHSRQAAYSISREQGEELLRSDLRSFEACVARHITVPLTPNQFAALVSWSFNVGCGNLQSSTLRRKLNAQLYAEVPAELEKWNRAGQRVLAGLTRRRRAEGELFLDTVCDDSISPSQPSVNGPTPQVPGPRPHAPPGQQQGQGVPGLGPGTSPTLPRPGATEPVGAPDPNAGAPVTPPFQASSAPGAFDNSGHSILGRNDAPTYVLPMAPPFYGDALTNPYGNVNPYSPQADELRRAAEREHVEARAVPDHPDLPVPAAQPIDIYDNPQDRAANEQRDLNTLAPVGFQPASEAPPSSP
jgi:lysozyme